jgi:hypothetical protein
VCVELVLSCVDEDVFDECQGRHLRLSLLKMLATTAKTKNTGRTKKSCHLKKRNFPNHGLPKHPKNTKNFFQTLNFIQHQYAGVFQRFCGALKGRLLTLEVLTHDSFNLILPTPTPPLHRQPIHP